MKKAGLSIGRLLTYMLIFLAGAAAERVGLLEYYLDPYEQEYVLLLAGEHLYMVAVSMVLAIITGVAVGIIFSRPSMRRYSGVVMYVVGLGQTLPSLAILALTMGVFGIGSGTAIFALFAGSLLPITRNTLSGILSVSPATLSAARGLGVPPWKILLEVELPNAMLVILTGVRVALVINIGTAALGYLIGAGGFGDLIFTGIQLFDIKKLLAGTIPVILIALLGDYFLELCVLWFVPRGLRSQK